jgi:dipeptidase
VFGPEADDGFSGYSTRRVWRVLSLAAPSLNLSPDVDWLGDGLPFSVKPDKPLSVRDVFAMTRDLYEGTKFDLVSLCPPSPLSVHGLLLSVTSLVRPRALLAAPSASLRVTTAALTALGTTTT